MADRQYVSPPTTGKSAVGTEHCPRVADLINYALGQCNGDDRQRVELHLQTGSCEHCRSWIEKASRYRAEPLPDASKLLCPPPPLAPVSPPPRSDLTPFPPSSQWQKKAFRDLEQRLRKLEES